MNKKKLEGIIEAQVQSLEVVAHNRAETEYLLAMIEDNKRHYKRITGRDYNPKEKFYDKVILEERA